MNDLIKQILEIPEENQVIEFKRLNGNKVVAKIIQTIVSMTNTEGGTIIIGVDDPEKTTFKGVDRIFGIEENLELFDSISEEIQKIVPPLSDICQPKKIHIDEINKTVALLYIPKATDNFRSINRKVYIRQYKSNIELTPQEVIKFAYAKGFEKADKELVDVDMELLNTETFGFWKKARKLPDEEIEKLLFKTGLARKDDKGVIKPTRASVLLFAEYPNDLMETKCTIRIFQYEGTIETVKETLNLIGTPKTIGGPILKQINDAHEYVLTLLRSGIKVPSGFKTEYLIPERAVKEAITNAVIHRDYFIKRDIEVRIFEDRVEIQSPGLFPYNITKYNIGLVRADGYRNDLIVKHLREFPEPPNLDQSEGIRAMRSEMKAQNLYPPIFFTYPLLQDSVRVVLINEKVATEWEKVNYYLEKNKYITNEEARNLTRVEQRDKMTKILKNWVEKGLLVQIVPQTGYVKGTKYRLPNDSEIN